MLINVPQIISALIGLSATFPLVLLKQTANLSTLFRQRTFHYVSDLVRLFLRAIGRKHTFHLVDLLPVLIPTYMRNLKIICQGEVCKIDKLGSLSIKTLKNMTPRKDGKWNIFQI